MNGDAREKEIIGVVDGARPGELNHPQAKVDELVEGPLPEDDGLEYVHGWRLALIETAVLLVIFLVCNASPIRRGRH